MKVVLTGTTGGLGSSVLRHILKLVPPSDIVLSVYNPSKPPAGVPAGVLVCKGDYADPASLDAAFAGAEGLFLVSYPSIAHELRVERHKAAIDAAKRCGIKRIWYTSLAFADGSVSEVMQAHLDTEKYIKESGLTYTIIREGIYTESFPLYLGFFDPSKGTDEVFVPGDGKIAWASRDDLGEATARLIVADTHKNQTILLSGPESNNLTLVELAQVVSRFLERQIKVSIVSIDEYIAHNRDAPPPRNDEDFLREWAKTYDAMGREETGVVSPLLGTLIGRPPRSVEEILAAQMGKGAIEQYAK
ncbi:NAD(P)-binding protein [Exidia glandulosa HHB12029]|uniref:NAD(P)-binding protein n=1 Tax=Exidia glandulosa HHB12029 TaxID=1314781 RepID=A0A166B662_EXIGL|nr:NAD(P)-binding protein [Exidia glandulosa HHB12029]